LELFISFFSVKINSFSSYEILFYLIKIIIQLKLQVLKKYIYENSLEFRKNLFENNIKKLKQNIKIYKEDNKYEDVLENIKRTHQANYLNNNRFNDIMK
jgi:hypothetical protein